MSRSGGLAIMLVSTYGLALYAFGCSDETRTRTETVPGPTKTVTVTVPAPVSDPHVPRGEWATTLGGVRWHVPAWQDLAVGAALRASASLEIDSAGVPSGWSVVVMDPGAYSMRASPTGLAVGSTDYASRTMHVAWAWPRQPGAPLFPALAHEVDHARTGNPCTGHPGCTLAPADDP